MVDHTDFNGPLLTAMESSVKSKAAFLFCKTVWELEALHARLGKPRRSRSAVHQSRRDRMTARSIVSKNFAHETHMRIWDTFTYNGELEALHARLAVPGIDKRVVVEALTTHSGAKKERLFYQWNLPAVRLVVPDLAPFATPWARENGQRNAIMDGLTDAEPGDVILLSDADEVPSLNGINRAVAQLAHHPAVVLCQRMYNFSRRWEDIRGWRGTVVTTCEHLRKTSPQALRDQRETLPRIADGGEHLSYFGGTQEVSRKLSSFAHTEYSSVAGDKALIDRCVKTGQDLFGRWSLQDSWCGTAGQLPTSCSQDSTRT